MSEDMKNKNFESDWLEKNSSSEGETKSPQKSRKDRRLDNIAKVLTVVFAFFIWLYVFSTNDATKHVEETFDVIPVQVMGAEEMTANGLAVLDMTYYNTNVTLRGTKASLSDVTYDNLWAYVDLSDVTEPGVYEKTVKYNLPSGVALAESMTKEVIEVTVDTVASKSFKVDSSKLYFENWSIASGCEIDFDAVTMNVDSVKIEAPTMLLGEITDLRIRLIDHFTMTSSTNLSAVVEALNASGEVISDRNLKITATKNGVVRSAVSVTLPLVMKKTVPLTLTEVNGVIGEEQITLSHTAVTIKGEPMSIQAIRSLSLGTFDIRSIVMDEVTKSFNVTLSALPIGVTELITADGESIKDGKLTVTATLKLGSSVTVTVPKTYFKVVGGDAEVREESLALTLTAISDNAYLYYLETAISEGREGITLIVNVADLDLSRENKAPVTVLFSSDFDSRIVERFAKGIPYTVTVSGGSDR